MTLLSGAIFIPSLALASGVWSRTGKLFEIVCRLELGALAVPHFRRILFLVCRQRLYTLNSCPKIGDLYFGRDSPVHKLDTPKLLQIVQNFIPVCFDVLKM
jgi:hypothetical protein